MISPSLDKILLTKKVEVKMELMPDELLIEVFQNLDEKSLMSVSKVCKRY